MKDIEESRTSRQREVFSEVVDASDRYEHANRTAESKEGTRVKIELRIMYVWLACSCSPHYIAHASTKTPLNYRRGHWLNGLNIVTFLQF